MTEEVKDVELDTESQPTEEVVNTEPAEEETPEVETEGTDALEEKNKKLYERAKKAEAEVKELKKKLTPPAPPEVKPNPDELSQSDLIAIIRADIEDEDIPEVKDYAKLKKISIPEALKTSFIKSFLKDKVEVRKSAEVANTGGSRRTTNKVSDDVLLEKAKTSDISDDDMSRLTRARLLAKAKK
jgi:hypothetical protein